MLSLQQHGKKMDGMSERSTSKQDKQKITIMGNFKCEYPEGDWQIENDWKCNSFILQDKDSEREHLR